TQLVTVPIEDRSGKKKQVASFKVKGIATADNGPLDGLMAALKNETSYVVPGREERQYTGPEREKYKREFTVKFEAEKRPTEKYKQTIPAAPARPARSRPGMGNFGGSDETQGGEQ